MLRRPPIDLRVWLANAALGLLALAVVVGAVAVVRHVGRPAPAAAVLTADSPSPSPTSRARSTAPTAPAATAPADTAPAAAVRAVVFGDSIVAGANAGVGNPTFVDVSSRLLGWTSSSFGFPGSGFTTAGTYPGGRDYLARIEQLRGYDVDVLVVEGGLNDGDASAATLRAKAKAVLARAHQLLPTTTIVVMGPWASGGIPTRPAAVADLTLKTLAKDLGLPFVDPISEQWITGAHPSTGNAAQYISSDGLYPNAKGHAYFGQRLAQDLTRLLPQRLLPVTPLPSP